MDANTLLVYNVIHKLGITDAEFDTITMESSCRDHSGTFVAKVTPKFMITINHDDKHNIEIVPNHSKLATPCRILFKTYFTFDTPQEIYVLHSLAQYRCDDNNPKYYAANLEELKDSIMDRICDKKYLELGYFRQENTYDEDKKRAYAEQRKELMTSQVNAIYWLFGESINRDEHYKINKSVRPNIPMIVKVFQRKNRRLAIIQHDKDYEAKHGSYFSARWTEHIERKEFRVNIYKPTLPQYNYVNEGRELLWNYDNEEVWLDDDLLGKIPSEELQLILENNSEPFTLINAKDYGRIQKTIRIKLMEDARKEQTTKAENKLRDSIDKAFDKGKIVRKGITFTHDSIEYNGIVLKADKIKEYVIAQRCHLQDEPEFTSIYEHYVEWLLKLSNYKSCSKETACYYSEFTGDPQRITIKGIKVVILKEHNFLFVNNHKISKFDIAVVVKNAINYDTQEAYDNYVVETSRTNLKVQQAIAEGYIAFDISFSAGHNDNFLLKESKSVRISIPLLRDKNKNYTIINGIQYPIQNTEALFHIDEKPENYYRDGELNRAIKLLYKGIKGITPKAIGEMLENGEQLFKEHYAKILADKKAKIDRSKEFLAHAVKLSKATKIKGGYKVKGLSGTVYTINADTLAVYKGTEYLCIVDMGDYELDTEPEALKNDRIAKRLLALSKDTVVAREIYKRGDHRDQHWLNLEEENKNESIYSE